MPKSRPHRVEKSTACLLLLAACSSAPPPEMKPDGVGIQNPTTPVGTAGNSVAAGGRGASAAAGTSNTPGNAPPSGTAGRGTAAPSSGGAPGGNPSAGAAGSGMAGPVDAGDFFVSGSWQGYVWTAVTGMGSAIDPISFKGHPAGQPRCVKGSVAPAEDYSGTAILGFNLSEGPGATMASITPTKTGVMIDIKINTPSALRFQVKGGSSEWCTPLNGAGGFIPWASLRTECWGTTGQAYNNEPISAAMILVPGSNMLAVEYDFCVNSLAEADGPVGGAPGTAGSPAAGSGGPVAGGPGPTMGTAGTSGGGPTGGPTVTPVQNGCDGFATRYWDCCKPHCGWSSNASSGALAACDLAGNNTGASDAASSCDGGSAYLCYSQAPWAVSDKLAYGFAAVAARSGTDICGKCYQLDFAGRSHNAGDDPGAAALGGKSMIVQAINIGGDVGSGQFDIAVPGGGVGIFNACTMQWSADRGELGPDYGGFLAACKQQLNASDHQGLKTCVMQKCMSIFTGKADLMAACEWYVDWFQVADNPALKYAEVACPDAIQQRGMRRGGGGGASCFN
jgi:hypothetical protein